MEQPPREETRKEKGPAPFAPKDINQAQNQIRGILHRIKQEGADDSEGNEIEGILLRLESGKLAPKMAIEEALDILNNKRQDYR